MRTISFSMTEEEHAIFSAEARCKGLTVAQYCKTAAFSHLAKYGSKGLLAMVVSLLQKWLAAASGPTSVASRSQQDGISD